MTIPFLEGKDVYLRPLIIEDANGSYVNWFNDPQVCEGNSHHRYPYTKQAALNYIEEAQRFDKALILAIVERETQKHVGNISLQKIDLVARTAEFAIVIGEREFWGKGFSKQASRLLLDHAFLTLNLNRVYCGTYENNIAMQNLAKYLGMKEEGRRRKATYKLNRYLDILEYGVLKEEFLDKFGK